METKDSIILRHKETGLYFSRMADHTKQLWSAWRFPDQQYLEVWFENHSYAPDPDEYEPVSVKLTIEVNEDVQ